MARRGRKPKKHVKQLDPPSIQPPNLSLDDMMGKEIVPDPVFPKAGEKGTIRSKPNSSPMRSHSVLTDSNSSSFPDTSQSLPLSEHNQRSIDESTVLSEPSTDGLSLQNHSEDTVNSRNKPTRKSSVPRKSRNPQVIQEIVRLQAGTGLVIPKLPFARLIREVLIGYSGQEIRITSDALLCLQESSEIYAVQLMEDAYRCTLHRDRNTLMPKDMRLAIMLRNDSVIKL
ncbi:uncharacterized protein LOC129731251 [Wyeomyia smithii]|uniref:uncharacterized protein LOC129731251 n=1 Tax=Wyeomyia smithii TaxID=174621 RepID=UPI002467FC03|nr:uncharacterized protein LOC129731251 [Wyeomyia smithii]